MVVLDSEFQLEGLDCVIVRYFIQIVGHTTHKGQILRCLIALGPCADLPQLLLEKLSSPVLR